MKLQAADLRGSLETDPECPKSYIYMYIHTHMYMYVYIYILYSYTHVLMGRIE